MSLPSIGPLYTIFDYSKSLNKNSSNNIYNFMVKILNDDNTFLDNLPIINTHFEKTISKLLTSKFLFLSSKNETKLINSKHKISRANPK